MFHKPAHKDVNAPAGQRPGVPVPFEFKANSLDEAAAIAFSAYYRRQHP